MAYRSNNDETKERLSLDKRWGVRFRLGFEIVIKRGKSSKRLVDFFTEKLYYFLTLNKLMIRL